MSTRPNAAVAEVLWQLSRLLALEKESKFKTRAYERAARVIQEWPEPLSEVLAAGRLQHLPGIGKSLASLVEEIDATGTARIYEALKAKHPPGVLALVSVPGLSLTQARKLHQALGLESVSDLEEACRQQRVQGVPGFNATREARILDAIGQYRARQGHWIYSHAAELAEGVLGRLRTAPHVSRVEPAGGLRRGDDVLTAIDLVVAAADGATVGDLAARSGLAGPVFEQPGGFMAYGGNGCPVRVHLTSAAAFGTRWLVHTGPDEHLAALQRRGALVEAADEEAVYAALGLPWIPPEVRGGSDSVDLIAREGLPPLLTRPDVLGDLHAHTEWSDGSLPIEAMAEAARARGYRYLAITDHSQSLHIARGLTPQALAEQGRRIDELNSGWDDFRLLKGTECDILEDGRMDFDDDVLASLDVVVASVHSHFEFEREAQTRRVVRAMENPHVDVIGHPTGRLLLKRAGLNVDVDALLSAATRTGTALELNGSPHRLDLAADRARPMALAGAVFSVDSDAHHSRELAYLDNGVRVARRAWLGSAQVVNAWPVERLLAWTARKR